jgi:hypothetical protein
MPTTLRDLHFLDYGARSGVIGIAAAPVIHDRNNRLRLCLRRSSSSSSSSNISSTTSKCGARSITKVGIETDTDGIHITNDNAHKNGVDMQNYLSGFDTLGQRGNECRD